MNLIFIIFFLKFEGRRIEMIKVISLEAFGSIDISLVEVFFFFLRLKVLRLCMFWLWVGSSRYCY